MVNHLDVTRVFLAVIFKDNQNSDEIVELCLVSTKTNKQDIQQDIEFAEIWISPLWWDLLARFKKYLHFPSPHSWTFSFHYQQLAGYYNLPLVIANGDHYNVFFKCVPILAYTACRHS